MLDSIFYIFKQLFYFKKRGFILPNVAGNIWWYTSEKQPLNYILRIFIIALLCFFRSFLLAILIFHPFIKYLHTFRKIKAVSSDISTIPRITNSKPHFANIYYYIIVHLMKIFTRHLHFSSFHKTFTYISQVFKQFRLLYILQHLLVHFFRETTPNFIFSTIL